MMPNHATPENQFPSYGVMLTESGYKSKLSLPNAALREAERIEREISCDPQAYRGRSIYAGSALIYKNPDPEIEVTYEIDEEAKIIFFYHFSAPQLPVPTVFVSYSHRDARWLRRFKNVLSLFEQYGLIEFWSDLDIRPAEEWRRKIVEKLESSRAAVLLVSNDFLKSEFIEKVELHKILSEYPVNKKKAFWVHLSKSSVFDTRPEISALQSLSTDPNRTLADLEEFSDEVCDTEIRAIVEKLVGEVGIRGKGSVN